MRKLTHNRPRYIAGLKFGLIAGLLVFTACNKSKKLDKLLNNSQWNIDLYESYTYINGVRDSAQDIHHKQAGYVHLNPGQTGEMVISNGPFTDTYRIEKWEVPVVKRRKPLTILMDVLYVKNNSRGTWILQVTENEKARQVWQRVIQDGTMEVKNRYEMTAK
ncbi:MAG: hypothetical protein JNL57_03595 [Bacteroidetes bacterium]|nr:hypothetical protein [Bacteroidota bacterium]